MTPGAQITKMTSVGMPRLNEGDVIQVWDRYIVPGSRASLRRVVAIGDQTTITVRELTNREWYWESTKAQARRLWRWIASRM